MENKIAQTMQVLHVVHQPKMHQYDGLLTKKNAKLMPSSILIFVLYAKKIAKT